MRKITYAKAVIEALMEEMAQNEDVIYLGEDMTFGGCLSKMPELQKTYGRERVIDTPISEHGFTNLGLGAAMAGLRPVIELQFADFAALTFDPIVNIAAKERFMSGGRVKTPAVIRTAQGVGIQCGSNHSQIVESWFINVPGIKIAVPSTPYDIKGLMKTAIRDDDPILFLEHRLSYYTVKGEVPEEEYRIPFGQANVARVGTDVTIVAWQKTYHDSMAAAEELASEHGINVEIIDPRTLVPFDKETVLQSIRKTGRAIVAHEAPLRGGPGGEISAIITEKAFDFLKAPVIRVGGENVPIPFGKIEFEIVPDKEKIKKAVLELVKKEIKETV
ncbi:alpha-ketoacid dehydrogenase subunit beta [Peribacillus frigoritolerans]|uniref:alpha-ketoacid dehydrogenase subunit beta n=1 Tax=Peribacillus frigoritolerans TaxID=450367 RepID=UPI003D2A15F3